MTKRIWECGDNDRAFTVAESVLTPEMAEQCRALIEAALSGRWSVRDLADSVKAVLAPSSEVTAPKEPGQ